MQKNNIKIIKAKIKMNPNDKRTRGRHKKGQMNKIKKEIWNN